MSETPTREVPTVPDEKRKSSTWDSISIHPPYGGDTILVPTPPALDDNEKVAAVSSNGKLRVPRKATPWILSAATAIAASLAICATQHPNPNVRLACLIAAEGVRVFGAGIPGGLEKKPKR